MKKYLVIYLRNNRIQKVFVVTQARDSKHAKGIVAVYHPADAPLSVSAICIDSIKGAVRSYA